MWDIQEPLDGAYYFFDCLNAIENGGYLPVDRFESERAAIAWGADQEAEVYKVEFRNGEEISNVKIYDPWKIFG